MSDGVLVPRGVYSLFSKRTLVLGGEFMFRKRPVSGSHRFASWKQLRLLHEHLGHESVRLGDTLDLHHGGVHA